MKKTLWLLQFVAGGFFLLVGEGAILLNHKTLRIWVTPFCWTGYILLVDGLLGWKWKRSLIRRRPCQFLLTIPLSTALWVIFEGYNLLLKNWTYLNIPPHPFVKYPGLFWSFGTILPALLETNLLLESLGFFKSVRIAPGRMTRKHLSASFLLGVFLLVYPLFTRSPFDFAPIWIGFIFLLEPLNYHFGGESLFRHLERGKCQRPLTLFLSGLIMGLLWEFWNYWAGAKWVYHFQATGQLKIFEMPLLGFLGFLPFSLEFYTMYHFVLMLLRLRSPFQD